MIGYLKGKIIDQQADHCVILVGGVGYEVQAPLSALAALSVGGESEFWIHTHVKEDALTLYGFSALFEKSFFLQLLKVNGVGPKMAMNILSGASVSDVEAMIEAEDVKGLSKLPKVGKKTAEQIILTLKGKLVALHREPASAGASSGRSGAGAMAGSELSSHRQLVSALVNLGFRQPDVEKVVAELPGDLAFEDRLRRGLQNLTGW